MRILAYGMGIVFLLCALAYGGYLWMVQSVEKPAYKVVSADEPFEIRDYPSMIVAEVTRSGTRKEAVSNGFGPLASYIFATRREGDKIAMTAPVTQTLTGETQSEWTVRFIMPSQYSLESLPEPAEADVRIVELPARRVAAVRFSGVPMDDMIADQEAALRQWLVSQNAVSVGAATYAYYNDPFTPGFLRRNEVLLTLQVEDDGV